MIFMAEFPGSKGFKFNVIFRIRRRHDNKFRLRKLEQDAFKCGQAMRVKVFNNLHNRHGVKGIKPFIAIDKGTLKKPDTRFLHRGHLVKSQFIFGFFKRFIRNIHACNFLKRPVFKQDAE